MEEMQQQAEAHNSVSTSSSRKRVRELPTCYLQQTPSSTTSAANGLAKAVEAINVVRHTQIAANVQLSKALGAMPMSPSTFCSHPFLSLSCVL